ncbi:MAG: hypothetical protein ACR2K2_17115 [Mycobacteriales bacterium]
MQPLASRSHGESRSPRVLSLYGEQALHHLADRGRRWTGKQLGGEAGRLD